MSLYKMPSEAEEDYIYHQPQYWAKGLKNKS